MLFSYAITSFYSLQFTNTDGNIVSMNSFQGKKVLIVNIATGCPKVDQLRELEQLQQQYRDSLVVIVFPSNSFGHETRSDVQIKQFCQDNYQSSFLIAAKGPVSGTGVQPVFNWLANIANNDAMSAETMGDFEKFVIDKNGNLVSVISSKVRPMDPEMIDAITRNY